MITHFNITVLTFVTLLTNQDETRRPASQFPVSPAVAHCILKAVKLCLLLSEADCCNVSRNEMLLLPYNTFYISKVSVFH